MTESNEPYAIEVINLSKVFQVLHRERSVKAQVLKWATLKFPQRREFLALDNLSFRVPAGQAIGVIGRNGSGKSTLLALMASIYRPSKGCIKVRGRVATLLELGAGFNAEFTGMENIFLNGVIMGMRREQLEERLDSIIEFSEVGEFINTPVKHYSSGMMTRLGFSVAIHTDPDVLLVDEVLAVGDGPFQEKCFQKMDEFKRLGKTIFCVSHDMRAIKRVSDRVLWIHNHVIRADGPPDEVLALYEAPE